MSRKIRVALSGSGFKFPAHVGALTAIQEAGYEIVEIIGTSGGSIVAAMFASGMKLADMEKLALTKDWSGMMKWSPLAILDNGFCNGNTLQDFISESTAGKKFKDLTIDLTVVASDIAKEQPMVFSKDTTPDVEIALACRASASIPFVYTPVRYEDTVLVDGGVVNNLACDRLKMDELPRFGVQLVSNEPSLKKNTRLGIVGMGMRLLDLMLGSCESAHVSTAEIAGAKIAFVETGYANSLDRNMPLAIRQRLFNDGYKTTRSAIEKY